MNTFYNNGFLIYDATTKDHYAENYVGSENYHGIHEFVSDPLYTAKDQEANKFAVAKDEIRNCNGDLEFAEFISNPSLLNTYIRHCERLNIDIGALFIQSTYSKESWQHGLPDMEFLGYEVCEIPFDPWALVDLFNFKGFKKYLEMLNENGLFSTEAEAQIFFDDYNARLLTEEVGDGMVDMYICKVYRVDLDDIKRLF